MILSFLLTSQSLPWQSAANAAHTLPNGFLRFGRSLRPLLKGPNSLGAYRTMSLRCLQSWNVQIESTFYRLILSDCLFPSAQSALSFVLTLNCQNLEVSQNLEDQQTALWPLVLGQLLDKNVCTDQLYLLHLSRIHSPIYEVPLRCSSDFRIQSDWNGQKHPKLSNLLDNPTLRHSSRNSKKNSKRKLYFEPKKTFLPNLSTPFLRTPSASKVCRPNDGRSPVRNGCWWPISQASLACSLGTG